MTYSIVARDHQTGAVGVIVASRFFAAGAMVPYVGPDFAIASQAFVNPIWGTKGRENVGRRRKRANSFRPYGQCG